MLRTSRYAINNNNADDDDDEIDSRNTRVNRLSVKPSDLNKVYKSIKGYFLFLCFRFQDSKENYAN